MAQMTKSQVEREDVSDKYDVLGLLAELKEVRGANRHLRRRIAALEEQRDRWRSESRSWQWGFLRKERRSSRSEVVSPSGRAEASVGG